MIPSKDFWLPHSHIYKYTHTHTNTHSQNYTYMKQNVSDGGNMNQIIPL